jgi:uncharacterized membrane-anchored protein
MLRHLILWALLLTLPSFANCQTAELDSTSFAELNAMIDSYYDSLANSFPYEYGEVEIGEGMASISVPEGFMYLNGEQSEFVLVELWENPPALPGNESWGMLFPEESGPLDEGGYAINITYVSDGYIDDSNSDQIDYAQLLQVLQADTQAESDSLAPQGYESVRLVGWAQEPYYDAERKKLHWALDLVFGDMETHTLNYNIRVLGRYGFLRLNVIGEMESLPEINANIEQVLAAVQFKEGYRYQDFDPATDVVAPYGINSIIAGRVLPSTEAEVGPAFGRGWQGIALVLVGLLIALRIWMQKKAGASRS